jgi:hypothetical protein
MIEVDMTTHRFNLEELTDLADELRLAGYNVGLHQYIAAQNLFIALAAHGHLPENPGGWRTLLAPIFCSFPDQQEDFYHRFDQWLERREVLQSKSKQTGKLRWFSLNLSPKFAWAIGVTLALIVAAVVFLVASGTYQLTARVVGEDGHPIVNAQISFLNQSVMSDGEGQVSIIYKAKNFDALAWSRTAELKAEHPDYIPDSRNLRIYHPSHQNIILRKGSILSAGGVGIPASQLLWDICRYSLRVLFLIVLSWLLWRWLRLQMVLRKLQVAGPLHFRRLVVKGASERLFQTQPFRRSIQELRRHRQIEGDGLDIQHTVTATTRSGGMFTPLYGSRRVTPEYLLMIDRASVHDEQARIGDELFNRLHDNGIFITRYYFQTDPRTCRSSEPDSPAYTLPDLAGRYHNNCTLIFGDGAGLINPFTGNPESWLNIFSHWPRCILLTPETPENWGYRESLLQEHSFIIVPATKESLSIFTETMATGAKPSLKSRRRRPPLPEMIEMRPKRWLENHRPQVEIVERLCRELKWYLGNDGWYWLSACAVYPVLSWDITLYLGYKLLGERDDFEEQLLALTRLPWFRYGIMPDWLRVRLIKSLRPDKEKNIRHAIEELLLSALDNPQGKAQLEIAERPEFAETWWRDIRQRLKSKTAGWLQRRQLIDIIRNGPFDSPLQDYVFIGFISGRKASRLVVNLPNMLRRMFSQRGEKNRGGRKVPLNQGRRHVQMGAPFHSDSAPVLLEERQRESDKKKELADKKNAEAAIKKLKKKLFIYQFFISISISIGLIYKLVIKPPVPPPEPSENPQITITRPIPFNSKGRIKPNEYVATGFSIEERSSVTINVTAECEGCVGASLTISLLDKYNLRMLESGQPYLEIDSIDATSYFYNGPLDKGDYFIVYQNTSDRQEIVINVRASLSYK